MSKREDEVTGWLDSLRADAERAGANQPQPDTATTPPRRRRRRRGVRQWLQDTFTPEPAQDLPAGTDVGSSPLMRQGAALRAAGVQAPPANFPRRYFDPYAALRDASETAQPVAADAASTPQSRRPSRVPGRPDPSRTGTIGPDTRNRTQRALDEERSRERRRLQERPAVVRALDYAGAGGAQTLTLGYRDELLGALSPVSTAEDFRERETLRREAATGGDRASGIAGAILGASVPIGAQNALLARSARIAPEGTAMRAALESFGTTGARTRLGDVARGVAEGLPYDLAYDYEDGESRGANLAIGALAGGVAGGLLRPGGGRMTASEELFVRPSSRRVRRGEGTADVAADRMDEIVRPRPGRESGLLAPDLNIDRPQEGAEVVPTWLRQLETDAARRRAPAGSGERVRAASIRYGGKVYEGENHGMALNAMLDDGVDESVIDAYEHAGGMPDPSLGIEAGFTSTSGRWLSRAEAASLSGSRKGEADAIREVDPLYGARFEAARRARMEEQWQSYRNSPAYEPGGVAELQYRAWRKARGLPEPEESAASLSNAGNEVDLDAWVRALPESAPVAPDVAPVARSESPATTAAAPVPDVAPAPAGQIDQAAEDAYRARRASINGQVRAGTLSREDADKRLKALGMQRAAERRRETGQLTDRERAAEARREASNYVGKPVVVQTEGGPVSGTVAGNTFGRVRVRMEDGSVISAMPDAVSPAQRLLGNRVGAVGDRAGIDRLAQTDTPEFRRWFGDSKVRDKQGQPLVVYHGTVEDFDTFEAGEFGFHFGDAAAAEMMGKEMPVFLSIRNPLQMPDMGVWTPSRVLGTAQVRAKLPTAEVVEAQRQIDILGKRLRKNLEQDDDQVLQRRAHYEWSRPVRDLLERHGYDGIIYKNEAEGFANSFIAFHPTQIKSATGNSGAFDPSNPNITGAATPDLLNLVARTGTGAVVGGAAGGTLDPENPARGAALGALAGAGLGAASMRGAINADANFAARRRAGMELAEDLRSRPRTEAGFVRTNPDEMATATPATTQRNRTGFPLALGPDRQVDPLRLPDTEALMDAGRVAVRPLQNQYGAVGDLSRLEGQEPPVPIWTGKRRGSDPTENPGVYYHVAPEGYRAGDPLKSFFRLREQGVEPEWKWDFDFADGGYEDGTRIALHDNLPEAADFQKEYGGQLLRVEIPENSGLFGGVNAEGYPYVEGEIPAEFIHPASTASTGAAGDFETSRNASAPSQGEPQTRTPQFNRWFGNSKIVDDSGEPLVVYKGMWPPDQRQEPMSSINRREFGGFPAYNGDEPDVDIAGFFSSSKDVANQFAQGVNSRGGHGPSVYPVYLSIQKPYVIDAKGNYAGEYQFGPEGKPFRDAIRSGNYDGVVIRNTGDEGDVYIPLHPEQIKSAIGNSGNFDPRNPDIAGAADPRLLGAVARTGAGALAGAAIDREDPLRGAAIGAGVGAAGPAIARSVARHAGNRIGAVGDISTLRTSAGAPRFYSRLENAVRSGQNAAPASQWLRYLDGHPAGIAKGEREWTGVDAWLRERGNQKVTRAELGQYLAQNRVRVGEVGYGATRGNRARLKELHDSYSVAVEASKGIEQQLLAALRATSIEPWAEASAISEIRQWGSAAIDASAHFRDVPVQERSAIYRLMDEFKGAESVIQRHDEVLREAQEATKGRYAGYQVAGGEPGTYREVLLTLDNDRLRSAPDDWRMEQDGSLWSVRDANGRRLSANQNREAALREALDKFNAERGNSIYRGPHWDEPNTMAHIRLDDRTLPDGERVLFMQEAQSDWHQTGREHGYTNQPYKVEQNGSQWSVLAPDGSEISAYWTREAAESAAIREVETRGVPNAPFKNTDEWLGLTLKRAVDEAVEGGYDRVAWSTGDQIWKVVSNDPKNLEGMREFYDKIIPRWLAKYGKKLGVEVEPIRLPGMENEMYRTEWVGPELTDNVMRDMAERAEPYYRADILHVMNATANPQQRAHALVHLMETGSDGFRTEMEYLLGSNPVQRVLDEGAGGTNLSIRITPALRETVQRQGQALYSFPGPILDALKTQAGQAAAGAGLGLAMEPDHPLYGALAGSAGALGVRVGYLRTSGRKMRNAIRRGTARVALSQFTDGQLEQLAKRYERLVPDVAAAMRGEVGERAARRTLTPQQIADRDVALLAEGPLKPVRQRVTRTLTAPEQSAITDAYRAGNEHVRRRIIDELEAAADDATPGVERVYSRLIGGLELEGFDPLPSRANPVLDAGRYANLSSFGLDPTGERRLADHVRRIVEAEGLDPKQRVTWEETKQVARELGMQPTDVSALAKSTRGLTAAELLAVRNQVRENVEGIERSSLRLAQMDGLETAEASLERQLLRQGIEQAEAQNTLLLSRFIRERSDAGRNLNALKILANQTMDPVVWRERAAAALKARGLEFQEAVHGARIREIIESCG